MLNKQNQTDKKIYLILFLIAFVVIFSSSYNPFNFRRMYGDSADYITVARGITRGMLPYRDLADNKGPLTYLISVPGWFLGKFTGIWITELILMCVSVLFAFKTALFFGNRNMAMFGTILSFVALIAFFQVNAGTEEYSLPFLMISFYIFTKYYFSPKQEVSFGELIALGNCFACVVMIRLNMFPMWVGFCVVIFVESVIKRRFTLLGKYIAGFCLGIIVIFVPVFLYLKLNGVMGDFMDQVILGGTKRGFSSGGIKMFCINFYTLLYRNNSAIPLYLGIFWLITKYKQTHFSYYCGYTFSYFLMLLFLSFPGGGPHYNLTLIPFFVPALTFLAGVLYQAFSEKKHKYALLLLMFGFIFSESFIRYVRFMTMDSDGTSAAKLIRAGRMIDENTNPGDKIIYLGKDAYIYNFTHRDPASKYFQQGSHLQFIPGSEGEFVSDILSAKPAIISISTAKGRYSEVTAQWYAPIMELINREYQLLSDENDFDLFIRRN